MWSTLSVRLGHTHTHAKGFVFYGKDRCVSIYWMISGSKSEQKRFVCVCQFVSILIIFIWLSPEGPKSVWRSQFPKHNFKFYRLSESVIFLAMDIFIFQVCGSVGLSVVIWWSHELRTWAVEGILKEITEWNPYWSNWFTGGEKQCLSFLLILLCWHIHTHQRACWWFDSVCDACVCAAQMGIHVICANKHLTPHTTRTTTECERPRLIIVWFKLRATSCVICVKLGGGGFVVFLTL